MKIKKGRHYGHPFPIPMLLFGKSLNKRVVVCFGESARYDLGDDQSDINKLFGFSYGFHHNNSDRIGWRYIQKSDQVEILLYSYVDKKRIKRHIAYMDIGVAYDVKLSVELKYPGKNRRVRVDIYNLESKEVPFIYITHFSYEQVWYYIKYTLGLYFGGNRKAPHNIIITNKNK